MTTANRFRFRAWDKFCKTMRSPESLEDYALTPEGLGFVRLFATQQEPEFLEHLVPLQSTGLVVYSPSAHGGVELFEGDIVRWIGDGYDDRSPSIGPLGVVEYSPDHCALVVRTVDKITTLNRSIGTWLEVIGNIHQNPDLLKSPTV